MRCSDCQQHITSCSTEAVVKVGEQFWHAHHFTCHSCGVGLQKRTTFRWQGQFYCEADFKRKFAPRCEECSDFITGKCFRLNGCSWHPDHLLCSICGDSLETGQSLFLHDDHSLLCQVCYGRIHSRKCFSCGTSILESNKGLQALGKDWHIACFVCSKCSSTFEDQAAFLCVNSDPVCLSCMGAN